MSLLNAICNSHMLAGPVVFSPSAVLGLFPHEIAGNGDILDRQKHLGAGWHERTPERQGHSNVLTRNLTQLNPLRRCPMDCTPQTIPKIAVQVNTIADPEAMLK